MRERFVPWSGSVSQWANWLSRQYGELEIWVRIPAKAQILSLKIIIYNQGNLERYIKTTNEDYRERKGSMGSSPGDAGEVPVMQVNQQKGHRMSCDVGEAMKVLENEV